MNLLTKIQIIKNFYGYPTSYFTNMMDAIIKANTDNEYRVTNVTVTKLITRQEPITWNIEHLLGDYYYNTQKPFDFTLINKP